MAKHCFIKKWRKALHSLENYKQQYLLCTTFTFQRCYNSIFANFEKLINVNLFNDAYFLHIYLNLRKILARIFMSMAFLSKMLFHRHKKSHFLLMSSVNYTVNYTSIIMGQKFLQKSVTWSHWDVYLYLWFHYEK